MQDPQFYLVMAAAGLVALAMVTAGMLTAWRGWLALKQQQMALAGNHMPSDMPGPSPTQRIEIADLKERIKKLEAIAAGVDL
ncbi:hypothetical protein COC42_16860 [Sphingomonas spermidinifaciens]|uniref:Uncharacterized protein n=1 Tax=Sphingomonas spermidinifaciens TaxID=1141889 RepID=A0A2A4B2D5_9SPHN|nr:hypothetical protein [Sphingomonas spermidinifaciens]PCD01844.1 hypothetical protein COC42_16860 [Sphingomonas spermidinifaciens]